MKSLHYTFAAVVTQVCLQVGIKLWTMAELQLSEI